MRKLTMLIAAAALAAPATTTLAGDAAAGKTKTATCVACHGQDGISIAPNYPNLACQKEQYLVDSMKAYKSGARKNPLMAPMVAALSDTDIADLAAYYSTLGCP